MPVQPPAIDLACSSYIRDHHCAPDYEALKAITGVGKRFRQIAMSHSQLWAYLSNSYTNGWNALLIERSREHKLVVDISSLHAHQTHERSRLDSLLHTVAAEMHRVFCLRIQDASGSEFFTRHRLLGTQAPSLQIFVCGGSKENLLSSFSGPLFGGHIPQLAIMDLACIALVPCQSSLAIRNLTTLSLSNIPTNNWPKYSELLALLRNCEQVRSLQLRSAGPRDWEGNAETVLTSPVNLPALETFVMFYNARTRTLQAIRIFLNHINATRLKSFTLSCHIATDMVTKFTMIPRSLCPIDNADHLSLSYPPSRSLRFRVNAPVPALNGKMPKGSDEQQFGLSIFDLKSRRDMVLGGLLLSAVDCWDLASTKKVSILFRGGEIMPCEPDGGIKTRNLLPHPRHLLERFPHLTALRLLGSCQKVDSENASHFVKALLSMNEDPPSSRIPESFVHLQLDHIFVTDPLKILLRSLRNRRHQLGFQLYYWENGRKAEW